MSASTRPAARGWIRHFVLACRSLWRSPAFTIPAVLTVAVGVGATTAVFTLAWAILLRPFPYPEADRIVRVFTVATNEKDLERNCSLLDIEEYNRRARGIGAFGGYTVFSSQITGSGASEVVTVSQLNQEALRAVGVQPVIGRLFLPEEDRVGGPVDKAILGHGLWQARYGGDPGIVGRRISTPMGDYEVVGVMPAGYGFPDRATLWLPMAAWYALGIDSYSQKQRDQRWYATVARLEPGVTLAQAQAEMSAIANALANEYPETNDGVLVKLVPLRDAEVGDVRPYLFLLQGGVGLVLVLCVANVANLMLARVLARRRQHAILAALGASRLEVVRSTLAESLLLSGVGGVIGAWIAWAALAGMPALLPDSLPMWMRIELDPWVLGFCAAVTLVVGALVASAAAWVASRDNLEAALRDSGRSVTRGSLARPLLVAAQVALSLSLLVGAGLLVKTFVGLRAADHGFVADGLYVASVRNEFFSTADRAERAGRMAAYHERMLTALAAIPGVESVAVTNSVPYSGRPLRNGRLRVQGLSDEETSFLLPITGGDVSWDYFATMGVPLLRGRFFERTDANDGAPVVVINERGARELFGDADPIGRMVQWGDTSGPTNPYCRIVGVVGDVRFGPGEQEAIELYYPFTQWPVGSGFYILRSEIDRVALTREMRRVAGETDPNAAIAWIKSMDDRIDEALWQDRLWGVLFSVFAVLAVLLAMVGLYGLQSYAVTSRAREIGIRLAVGARPRDVRRMVLANGLRIVTVGVVAGAAAVAAAMRLLEHLLTGVAPYDWTVFGVTVLSLVIAGLAASILPATRASRIDPLRALREE